MNKANNIIKSSVTIKQSKNVSIKRKKKFTLFKRRSKHPENSNRAVKNIKGRRLLKNIFLYSVFFILAVVIIFGIYFSIKGVVSLRQGAQVDTVLNENVYGYSDVPAYPYSEFIFKDELNNELVKTFLSKGNSVYRLIDDHSINDVFKYYETQLANNGWEFKLNIPITSQEQLFGQYWIKNGKGLRIYSRLNDIWYQSITVAQATNGMRETVAAETARKLLLLTTNKVELLPNYPWLLSYPSDYSTKYYGTNISTFQGVSFKKIGSDSVQYIEPVGYNGALSAETYISRYLSAYNKKHKSKWQVINTKTGTVKGNERLSANITDGSNKGSLVIMNNTSNHVMYIFSTFTENDPFFDYILSNITAASSVN